jgi:hypothetical protein
MKKNWKSVYLEDRLLRKISGPKRDEITRVWRR